MSFIQKIKKLHKRLLALFIILVLLMASIKLLVTYLVITGQKGKFSSLNTYREFKHQPNGPFKSDDGSMLLHHHSQEKNEQHRQKNKEPHLQSSYAKSTSSIKWCRKQLRYHSKSNQRYRIALASFPGSGNTWVRYLLQQASGILTGSVYHDLVLKKDVYPGILMYFVKRF